MELCLHIEQRKAVNSVARVWLSLAWKIISFSSPKKEDLRICMMRSFTNLRVLVNYNVFSLRRLIPNDSSLYKAYRYRSVSTDAKLDAVRFSH